MATIQATVVTNEAGDITLNASRKGTCSKCAQSNYCSLIWRPDNLNNSDNSANSDNLDNSVSVSYRGDMLNNKGAQHHLVKAGDTVNLHCDDKSLVRYICILFMPSLLMLLFASLLLDTYTQSLLLAGETQEDVSTVIVILSVGVALYLGALSSKVLLKKNSKHLQHPTLS